MEFAFGRRPSDYRHSHFQGCIDARSKELQRADELTADLADILRKHVVELADLAKKLADCESARSSEVECKIRFESDCGWLEEQLKLVAVQLE